METLNTEKISNKNQASVLPGHVEIWFDSAPKHIVDRGLVCAVYKKTLEGFGAWKFVCVHP